jgi:hypothetical protein
MEKNKVGKFQTFLVFLLCLSILLIIILEIILGMLPSTARDVLIHHLAIPKLWITNGGFYEIKWADFSYYPMNVDLLYLIPLYFNQDFIANFIHLGFGIGTGWLIYRYLNNKLSRLAGLLGVFIFLSTPIVVRMSTVAYVDLGLTFFTTAAILAMVRWRDESYQNSRWLMFSSVAMGLALGTKYNALIAWLFLSFSAVYLYSRDTGKQWPAVRYGVIFFLVSLLVFSPWLIKNSLLTGNPLYPLFKGFFPSGMSGIANDAGARSMVSGDTYMGLFQMREIMYGENFWETLLTPIRFFFQGQDYSDRYFDGVLNPILIILVPFAFMEKSIRDHKLFFVLFAAFFILAAFFLDQLRIRYILPAIPILTILTVMGIMNLFAWAARKTGLFSYFCFSALFLFLLMFGGRNIVYLHKYFQSLQPVKYVLNQETRDAYLQRFIRSYTAMRYINEHTPENSRIRLLFLAGRGYYLDRIYEDDATYGMDIMRGLAASTGVKDTFRKYLESLKCTHLLIREDLSVQFLRDNYPPETIERLFQYLGSETELIHRSNGYGVYKIIPSG